MRLLLCLPALLLTACDPSQDGPNPDDTGTPDGGHPFEYFVYTQDVWVGETDTCLDGVRAAAVADPSCQADITLDGVVEDFQEGDGVPEADVEVWADDDISGGATATTAADDAGNFTITAPSCTPFAYGTSTPPDWFETKDTYEVHQVYGYESTGTTTAQFNSVSEATSRLIPGLIGVEWEEDTTGIIAGTAYDCAQNPIQNAQIYIHDAEGNGPGAGEVFYFSISGDSSLPTSRDQQPQTNTDGLWVAVNIPAGTWTVEMYGWDGSANVLLGTTVLQILIGSVNISNIYAGDLDGIYYPDSCLTTCGG